MHRLSLRFHLEKKTGGLTRVLERGRNGIETIVRMTMLTGFPTIVEFLMILGVLLWQFDWRYAAVTVAIESNTEACNKGAGSRSVKRPPLPSCTCWVA